MNRRDLLLTCLKFINHLRSNTILDEIEIGNTSCRNCLYKIKLFFDLYKKYFGNENFDIQNEIKQVEKYYNMIELSPRETEIAKLLCLSDTKIAKRLFIAPSTVKTHIYNMRCKTVTSSKAATLIELIKTGTINIDEVETE